MKKIVYIYLILLVFIASNALGQVTISRQVISTTGGYNIGSTMTLSSTVGEVAIQTIFSASTILTQGFQQSISTDSRVTYEVINEACNGANNGSIFIVNVLGCAGPYAIEVKELNSTTIVDETALSTGSYTVAITGASGCTRTVNITVGLDSEEECTLKFYSGFTPNDDGRNDQWNIEYIGLFPENFIQIFNRWGVVVWSGENYDNTDVVWKGLNNNGREVSEATYFYVAKIGTRLYKGWIEVSR